MLFLNPMRYGTFFLVLFFCSRLLDVRYLIFCKISLFCFRVPFDKLLQDYPAGFLVPDLKKRKPLFEKSTRRLLTVRVFFQMCFVCKDCSFKIFFIVIRLCNPEIRIVSTFVPGEFLDKRFELFPCFLVMFIFVSTI